MSGPPRKDAPPGPGRPKRFYTTVAVAAAAEGATRSGDLRILLDGRPLRTPAKAELAVPGPALAEAIAQEWRAQGAHIDPASMPLTRIANTTLDGVEARRGEVEEEIAKFACSDLVCYRAVTPEALAARQSAAWDPVLGWAGRHLKTAPRVGRGIVHVTQPAELAAAVRQRLAAYAPLALAGLHVVTTLTGSALMALALAQGDLGPEEVWLAAHVDEDYQAELWGHDAEADRRRAARHGEFMAAHALLGLLARDGALTLPHVQYAPSDERGNGRRQGRQVTE